MRRLAKASSAGTNRATLGVALFVVALLALVLSPAAIAADQTYLHEGTFAEEGGGDGQLTHPRRVAVENSTGNVLVADRDNGRVQVFAPSGAAAAYLTQFGAATLEEPFGIAIDQASGDVYVSDAGKEQVFKFTSDGAPTPAYSLDGTFTSPAKGPGAGQVGGFEADLAVDPTSGDLIVADPGNDRVSRFEADGTFVSSFTGADSPDGAFTGLLDLDVAPNGDVYVVDSTGPVFVEGEAVGGGGPETCVQNNYCETEPSRVLRFASAGAYQETVQGLEANSAGLVTVDPNNGQVLVGRVNPQRSTKIAVYAPGGDRLIDVLGFPFFFTWFPSMAVQEGGAGRLYVVTDKELQKNFGNFVGQVRAQVFSPVTLPEATIDPVATVTATTAQLSGDVNPQGSPTSWRFEYRAVGGPAWLNGPAGNAGSGGSPVAVSGQLAGLEPNSDYEVRLTATGAGSKVVTAGPVSFKTGLDQPGAFTGFAAPRTETTARLNGRVNPRNAATTYFFEWGPTAAYGNSLPVAENGSAGSGGVSRLVAEQLTGLQPGTTYHYRLVAINAAGRSEGADLTFETRTGTEPGPPRRGIELVSAPDKGNQNAEPIGLSPSGTRVLWSTFGGSPGAPTGTGGSFVSVRGGSGWASHSVLPPIDELIGKGDLYYKRSLATDNLDKFVWMAQQGLLASSERGLALTTDGGPQTVLYPNFPPSQEIRLDATEDLAHVFGTSSLQIDPGAPFGVYNVYEFTTDPPELVTKMQDGEAPACGIEVSNDHAGFAGAEDGETHWTSANGRRVFFESKGDQCSGTEDLYLRDRDAETTTLISGPPLSGPQQSAIFLRANASATEAVFATKTVLAPDDGNETMDLYRYVAGAGNQCLTCVVPNAAVDVTPRYGRSEEAVVSADLSTIYFTSFNALTPDARADRGGIYMLRDGELDYVAPSLLGQQSRVFATTADGGVALLGGVAPEITADPPAAVFSNVYRYGAADGSVECVSCTASGQPSQGIKDAAISVDGDQIVFRTTTALVPEDINSGADIYEWRNGQVALVTDGESEWPKFNGELELVENGISADGNTVLFTGGGVALTGYERDDVTQIYAARVGGGFPPPPLPPAPCNEDDCQGPISPAPGLVAPSSATASGPGNERAAKPRKSSRCRKVRAKKKGRARAAKAKPRCVRKASKTRDGGKK